MPTNRDARFGISVDGRRSRLWRVRSGANAPELFIEHERLAQWLHYSLHESGNWHLKISGRAVTQWPRPNELHPGYTRALVIVQAAGVADCADPSPPDALLADLASDERVAAEFNVFIERPGANLASWPGKNSMGTELVARLPLARHAGTCAIVLQRAPAETGQAAFARPSEDQLADMRDSAARGELYTTMFGELSDGAMWAMDGKVEPLAS